MENGYLIVKEAFSRAQAAEFTKDLWVRLGLDPADASTWDRERIHMPWHRREPIATFAPRVSVPARSLPPPPPRLHLRARSPWSLPSGRPA